MDAKLNAHFLNYKNQLLKIYGTKALDNEMMTVLGNNYIGTNFKGVFPQNKVPLDKPGYFIVNTDFDGEAGTHWVALISTSKKIYIYDSFGRKHEKLLKNITKRAKFIGKKVVDSDPDPEQFGNTEICGPLSIAFLLVAKKFGPAKAVKYI